MEEVLDIAIIGAGPAGLSAAINAAIRNKKVKVFSNENNYLQKAEMVDNYLGIPDISGQDLMALFLEHVRKYNIEIVKGKVVNLVKSNDKFMINLDGEILFSRVVIIATGVVKNKAIPNEERLLGRGVSYCATCDGMLYRNKRVVVYGNSRQIVKEANYLADIGAEVTFLSSKDIEGLSNKIKLEKGIIREILGENKVSGIQLQDKQIETDGVFILRDQVAPNSLVSGLKLDDGYIVVNRNMETNIEGIYACGDCVGEPLQIAKATGEGLIAAQCAAKYLDNIKEMD